MTVRFVLFLFFQAEDGIRDLVRSRGLGDVYKRQDLPRPIRLTVLTTGAAQVKGERLAEPEKAMILGPVSYTHLTLPTSDLV